MHQVQDERDSQFAFNPDPESAFAVGQRNAGERPRWIAAVHFGGHLIDDGGLALDQTGPHALALRPRDHGFVSARLAFGGEQAFQDLLGSADPGRTGKDGSHGGHALFVGLRPLVKRRAGCGETDLTTGMPLPSTAATRIEPVAASGGRCW